MGVNDDDENGRWIRIGGNLIGKEKEDRE